MSNNLAGHFRLTAAGVIEFASGYDDAILPRDIVAASVTTAASRGWLHAIAAATGESAPEIVPCNCGAPRPTPGLGHSRGIAPNRKPAVSPADPKPDESR